MHLCRESKGLKERWVEREEKGDMYEKEKKNGGTG